MVVDAKTLCELPEVFRVVNMLVVLIDHAGKRIPGVLISQKDNTVQTFRDAVAEVLAGVGFVAEWVPGKNGRQQLSVKFPSKEAEARFVAAADRTEAAIQAGVKS